MTSNRKKFGTLEGGRLVSAPLQVKYNGVLYALPPDEVYTALGYKEIIDEKPIAEEGMEIAFNGYHETDSSITLMYEQIPIQEQPQQDESYEISKFYLRIALTKLGLWE